MFLWRWVIHCFAKILNCSVVWVSPYLGQHTLPSGSPHFQIITVLHQGAGKPGPPSPKEAEVWEVPAVSATPSPSRWSSVSPSTPLLAKPILYVQQITLLLASTNKKNAFPRLLCFHGIWKGLEGWVEQDYVKDSTNISYFFLQIEYNPTSPVSRMFHRISHRAV